MELSTTDYRDGILITFTGADVTAVGGNVWSTGSLGGLRGGYITLELDDGTFELFSATSPENFRGLSTTSAIRSIFIDMPDGSNGGEEGQFWVTMSSLYIGQVVPSPGSIAMLCIAGLGVSRRRR